MTVRRSLPRAVLTLEAVGHARDWTRAPGGNKSLYRTDCLSMGTNCLCFCTFTPARSREQRGDLPPILGAKLLEDPLDVVPRGVRTDP